MIADRSYVVRASFNWTNGDEGIVFSLGDRFCGLVLFVENGALHCIYQWWFNPRTLTPMPLTEGEQSFVFDLTACGARKGRATLTLNGTAHHTGVDLSPTIVRVPANGLSVGLSRRLGVSESYAAKGTFVYTGSIARVRIEPGEPAPDSLITFSEEVAQADMRNAASTSTGITISKTSEAT
jgi:hypothetical protein